MLREVCQPNASVSVVKFCWGNYITYMAVANDAVGSLDLPQDGNAYMLFPSVGHPKTFPNSWMVEVEPEGLQI